MADARDGNKVDIEWFINHVWYLCAGVSKNFFLKNIMIDLYNRI